MDARMIFEENFSMNYRKIIGNTYAVRLSSGEDIIASLARFAAEKNIGGAVSAIGSIFWAELGYFDVHEKKYIRKRFDEEMEIVSLMGNITYRDGEPVVHLHAVLGRADYSTIGGHLFAGEVSATCEIIISPWNADEILRKFDGTFNLALWDV